MLSMPDGVPWATSSHWKARRLISSSLSPSLKWRSMARMIATATAAEPPRPMARGISE